MMDLPPQGPQFAPSTDSYVDPTPTTIDGPNLNYDTVLDPKAQPVHSDDPEKVKAWLAEHADQITDDYMVFVGKYVRIMSVLEYTSLVA